MKPTFSASLTGFGQALHIRVRPRLKVDNGSRQAEAVPGAYHRGQRSLPVERIGRGLGERADRTPPREPQGRLHRLRLRQRARFGAIFLGDSGNGQGLSDPPFACTTMVTRSATGAGLRASGR